MTINQLWTERYRPDTVEGYVFRDNEQKAQIETWIKAKAIPHLLFSGPAGTGKAQPLTAKIKTPDGWTTMGNVAVGDPVLTPNGDTAEIIEIFPQGKKEIYEVTFKDGRKTECCNEHLWRVYNYDWRSKWKIMSTGDIIDYYQTRKQRLKIQLPIVKNTIVDLPLAPYFLGAMLGGGGLGKQSLGFSTGDPEMIGILQNLLPVGCRITKKVSATYDYQIAITEEYASANKKQGKINEYANPTRTAIYKLGLMDTHSHTKFIPAIYKNGSIEQREDLIAGLIDTDGHVDKRTGAVSITTVSEQMAKDIQEIIWSLGGIARISHSDVYNAYTVGIRYYQPNRLSKLSRKKELLSGKDYQYKDLKLQIESIIPAGQKEAQCIMIDHPDHLYITDDYVVTHNTTLAKILINQCQIDEYDVKEINASRDNRVEYIREVIEGFVQTMPFGDYKVVLLDEADYLTPNAQAVLRGLMEKYAQTARFILTCNFPNKIIGPLHSRCQGFHIDKIDMTEFTARVAEVLITEGIEVDIDVLDNYVRITYPDLRKCLNLVQMNSTTGSLVQPNASDSGSGNDNWKVSAVALMKEQKYTKAREIICASIRPEEVEDVIRWTYNNLDLWGNNEEQQDEAILIIRKGLVNHTLVADPEINLSAMLIELSQIGEDNP